MLKLIVIALLPTVLGVELLFEGPIFAFSDHLIQDSRTQNGLMVLKKFHGFNIFNMDTNKTINVRAPDFESGCFNMFTDTFDGLKQIYCQNLHPDNGRYQKFTIYDALTGKILRTQIYRNSTDYYQIFRRATYFTYDGVLIEYDRRDASVLNAWDLQSRKKVKFPLKSCNSLRNQHTWNDKTCITYDRNGVYYGEKTCAIMPLQYIDDIFVLRPGIFILNAHNEHKNLMYYCDCTGKLTGCMEIDMGAHDQENDIRNIIPYKEKLLVVRSKMADDVTQIQLYSWEDTGLINGILNGYVYLNL